MHIRNVQGITPLVSDHGEVVYELLGAAAGGTQQHSLAQVTIPPGKASLKHYHPVAEESYYILSGTGRLEMGGGTALLRAGDGVAIPAMQVHQVFNVGDDDLVLLAVCVPAWTPDNSVYLD